MEQSKKSPAAERLSETLRSVLQEWLDRGEVASAQAVNAGMCGDFSAEVMDRLSESDDFADLDDLAIDNIQVLDGSSMSDGLPFDRAVLAKHWPMTRPPEGMDWDDLDRLAEDAGFHAGTHVWLHFEGRHYDVEAPDGVDSLFDLPFLQRAIEDWKIAKTPSMG